MVRIINISLGRSSWNYQNHFTNSVISSVLLINKKSPWNKNNDYSQHNTQRVKAKRQMFTMCSSKWFSLSFELYYKLITEFYCDDYGKTSSYSRHYNETCSRKTLYLLRVYRRHTQCVCMICVPAISSMSFQVS